MGEMSSWFVTNKSWLTFDRGNVLSVFTTVEVLKVSGLDSVRNSLCSLFTPRRQELGSNANKTKEESEEGGEVDGSYDGRNFNSRYKKNMSYLWKILNFCLV